MHLDKQWQDKVSKYQKDNFKEKSYLVKFIKRVKYVLVLNSRTPYRPSIMLYNTYMIKI